MIFNFTVSGKEEQIMEFEKELLDILIRIVENNEMLAHEIHFCIHEVILNIIQHSYNWDLEIPIEVKLNVSGSHETQNKVLDIQIKDSGPAIEKPIVPPSKIEKFQMRHRGLYMISKIMDEFSMEALGKNGNLTKMKKDLSKVNGDVLDIVSE